MEAIASRLEAIASRLEAIALQISVYQFGFSELSLVFGMKLDQRHGRGKMIGLKHVLMFNEKGGPSCTGSHCSGKQF